jgi:hypothetical protein
MGFTKNREHKRIAEQLSISQTPIPSWCELLANPLVQNSSYCTNISPQQVIMKPGTISIFRRLMKFIAPLA